MTSSSTRRQFKDLKKLDRPIQQRLIGLLKTRVASLDDPRALGEALAGAKLGNYWKSGGRLANHL